MIFQKIITRDDLFPCALCEDAPCTKACRVIDCARLLRAAWFDNEQGAARALPQVLPCEKCPSKCEKACVLPGAVRIRRTMLKLSEIKPELDISETPDASGLRTTFAGFALVNPFLLDARSATDTLDKCRAALASGYGGLLLNVTGRAQTRHVSPQYDALKMGGSVVGLVDIGCRDYPSDDGDDDAPSGELTFIPALKREYPNRMIVAVILGSETARCVRLAALSDQAGADALLIDFSRISSITAIEECVRLVSERTERPVILRLSHQNVNMIEALDLAENHHVTALAAAQGIMGILAVNRHTCLPEPSVHGQSAAGRYNGLAVKPGALAVLTAVAHKAVPQKLDILAGTGVECWSDALDFLLLGANAVCVSEAVLYYGLRIIDDLTDGLSAYILEKNFDNVGQIVGMGLSQLVPAEALDTDTVIYPRISRTKCIKCGRCHTACREAASGAIVNDLDHAPMLIAKQCTGCHLCVQVCPTGAITISRRNAR